MIKLIQYSPEPNYYKGCILEVWLDDDPFIDHNDPVLVSKIVDENSEVIESRNFIKASKNAADPDIINWKLHHARNYFVNKKYSEKYGFYFLHKIWTNKEALIDLFIKRNKYPNELWRAELWAKLND
jgi:hypothetical protein